MENFSYHVPFYIVNGGIATQGHSADLTAGRVALIDRQTWSVATSAGNGKEFFFAQGNTGGLDWNQNRVTATHKSPYFYAKSVSNIYKSTPQRLQNEEWVIGFDGSDSSRSFNWAPGKTIRLKFIFSGDPIYRKFAGPKEYQVSYTVPVNCANGDCVDDCVTVASDCRPSTVKLIDLINTHTELRQFGVTAKLVSVPDHTKYCLSLCDKGDVIALQRVQSQAPVGVTVVRTSRVESISTYQFCQLTAAVAPVAFTQTGSIALAVCGSCTGLPGSPTLVPEKDVYLVRRPLAGSEVLTSDAARDTFADTVGTAYGVAADADKIFLGQDGAVALIQIKVAANAVVAALLADTVEFSHTEQASCSYADATPVAWVTCGVGISSSRTLTTKLARPICDQAGNRLAELTALLATFTGISGLTLVAGVACVDEYTIVQKSKDCLDEGCLTENVSFTYEDLPSLDNAIWEVDTPGVANVNRKCGIRVTAGYVDPKFGNCSFDPHDYYNDEPIKFELAVFDEDANACDYNTLPTVFRSKAGTIQRQTGEYVVREVLMKTEAYLKHVIQYDNDTRMREAFDMNLLDSIDRTAFYDLYYVTFNDSYHIMDRKNESEKFTAVFAFKEGDASAKAFEVGPLAILTAKSGVALHVNS